MTGMEKKRAFRWFLAAALTALLFVACTTGPVSDLPPSDRGLAGATALSE